MQPSPVPLARDLVLVGGGHTHALVLRMLGMRPVPGLRLTLIDPGPVAAYSGMLPGFVAGHYAPEALEIDLVRLARFAGARFVAGRAAGIDRHARRISVEGRAPVFYDIVSIDIGITTEMPGLPGFAGHAVPAKPLGAFAARWAEFVAEVEAGRAAPVIAVIGAGVAGVELALACAHRLRRARPRVTLIEADAPLRDLGPAARARLLERLRAAGIEVLTGAPAAEVTAEGVRLGDGRQVPARFVLGAAGARPQGWLEQTGLALEEGFVRVGPTLASETDPAIFAAGDCAHLSHAPRPKAGVYAVRAAPVLAHNLRAALTGGRARRFRPQADYLKLISLGGRRAFADRSGLRREGALLWRWKDHIDRKFMRKLTDLPPMRAPERAPRGAALGVAGLLHGDQMPCGGCAAKAGAEVLEGGLAGLPPPTRADVLSGAGGDAAALAHGTGAQLLSADQFRAVTDDPWTLARIAAVHALGDVWAEGAAPQAALALVTLARMRPRMQSETLREIIHGASSVFTPLGADLLGGHSALGCEMMLGFAVTGLRAGQRGFPGPAAGDALVLTKPLGSGTLMAGAMAGAARGADVLAALRVMATPSAREAEILAPVATAMTDVTGFGLIGHLRALLNRTPGGAGATIEAGRVPLIEGATALAASGLRSTLYAQNAALAPEIAARAEADPRLALLFDPQTAGGLLASVPKAHLADTLARLCDITPARHIGEVTDAAGHIALD